MALKISKKNTRRVRITATEPLDLGQVQNHTFEVELKVIPKEQWDDKWRQPVEDRPTDRDILDETLSDLVGLVDDETNEPLAFDNDIKQIILDTAWVVKPIINAQVALQNGQTPTAKKLKTGN